MTSHPRQPRPGDDRVRAALSGDRDALDGVLDDWLPTLYSWCARLGAGRIDAEEAAHDVMMIFVRRHATVRGPAELPAWLFNTCRRVVANYRRHVWWQRWAPGARVAEREAPDRPDRPIEEQQLADQIEGILGRLSASHREVLVLCYLEDRSVSEAAEILQIPEGTVKSRLFNARARFREHFSAGGPQ